jgi:hypothetical protein
MTLWYDHVWIHRDHMTWWHIDAWQWPMTHDGDIRVTWHRRHMTHDHVTHPWPANSIPVIDMGSYEPHDLTAWKKWHDTRRHWHMTPHENVTHGHDTWHYDRVNTWLMTHGMGHTGIWHMNVHTTDHDTWHMTHDTWHWPWPWTHDTWHNTWPWWPGSYEPHDETPDTWRMTMTHDTKNTTHDTWPPDTLTWHMTWLYITPNDI